MLAPRVPSSQSIWQNSYLIIEVTYYFAIFMEVYQFCKDELVSFLLCVPIISPLLNTYGELNFNLGFSCGFQVKFCTHIDIVTTKQIKSTKNFIIGQINIYYDLVLSGIVSHPASY